MFDFLTEQALTSHDFNEQIEFLIPDFLPKNLITLIYADGGMGKSWLALAIAKLMAGRMNVVYLDYDNPLSVLKERGVQNKLVGLGTLFYVQRSKSRMAAPDMLAALEQKATAREYDNTLFIIDSLRNFCDVNNDGKAMTAMDQIMNLREAGATVLILSHANKDGKNYQGSNNIRNSVDNMYRLTKIDSPLNEIRWVLSVKKERASIIDCAFKVTTSTLMLHSIDVQDAQMDADEKAFVTTVQGIIRQQPGINKKLLLSELGFKEDDKTARTRLDTYEGIYWQSAKQKGAYCYQLSAVAAEPTSATSLTSIAV